MERVQSEDEGASGGESDLKTEHWVCYLRHIGLPLGVGVAVFFTALVMSERFFPAMLGGVATGLGYSLLHPLLGKAAAQAIEGLCSGLDWTFDHDDADTWANWKPTSRLAFAIFWPFCFPPMLFVTVTGITFGYMYRSLFSSK